MFSTLSDQSSVFSAQPPPSNRPPPPGELSSAPPLWLRPLLLTFSMPSNRQKNGHSAFKGASLFSSLPPDMKRVLRQQTFEPLEMIGKVSGGPPSSSSSVGQLIATQPESQSDSAIEKQEKYQSGISLSPAASSSNSSKRKKFKSGASSMNVQSGLTNGHGKRDRDTAQNAYGISEYEEGKSKGKARAADVDHGNGDHLDDEHAHQSPSTAGQAQGRGGTINVGFEEGKQHPWNVTGLVERYENWDSVPHNVRKCESSCLSPPPNPCRSLSHPHGSHPCPFMHNAFIGYEQGEVESGVLAIASGGHWSFLSCRFQLIPF